MNASQHIVFVCTGNICRSPSAHAVLRQRIAAHALSDRLSVDSAGLEGWHTGKPPDARSIRHARRRGYELSDLRARPLRAADFDAADWVLVMDHGHLQRAMRLCAPAQMSKLRLLGEFSRLHPGVEVPDPYYGDAQGFEHVLDLIEDACDGLLDFLGHAAAGGGRR